ncbi:MAG: hypothetical protein H6739_24995 [Alphaproteobacteria bacterium]|nr:hypothetical protein [Alphaproteobacteria bacterium]
MFNRPKDASGKWLEIDPGTMNVKQGAYIVGRCWCKLVGSPSNQQYEEYWVLYPNFDSPKWDSVSNAAVNDMIVEAVDVTYTDAEDFRDDQRDYVNSNFSGQLAQARYIEITRQDYDGIPTDP